MRERNAGTRGELANLVGLVALTVAVSSAWGVVQGFMWSATGKGFWSGFGWGFGEVLVILIIVFLAEPGISALMRRLR
jgi:hypothetical protein